MTASRQLRVVDDAEEVAAAVWVTPEAGGGTVGAILPRTFAAHARVLHPAYLASGDNTRPVRWSELGSAHIAASTGFEDLTAAADGVREDIAPPVQGSMPPELIPALLQVLARHTRTPERCWFAVWEGFSGVRVRDETALRLVAPDRRFVLLRGPLAAAATNLDCAGFQTPNLWWP